MQPQGTERLEARIRYAVFRSTDHGDVRIAAGQFHRIAEDQVVAGVAVDVIADAVATGTTDQDVVTTLPFKDVHATEVEVA